MSSSNQGSRLDAVASDARRAALTMGGLDAAARDTALAAVRKQLENQRAVIEAANALDIAAATKAQLDAPLLRRLEVRGKKFDAMLAKLDEVRAVADPVGAVQLATRLDDGLDLYRVACPIGVVAVIFESRPDAAVQISALAIKSANALILKGGKEAAHTNAAIVSAIQAGLAAAEAESGRSAEADGGGAVPSAAVQLVASRDEVSALLGMHGKVDLIVPRGSNALVSHIINNTRIPVLGHADGICAVYLDATADEATARRVVLDAKTDYPVACNAAETLLLHASLLSSPTWRGVAQELIAAGVTLKCDTRSSEALAAAGLPAGGVVRASEADYRTEFGGLTMAVKVVADVVEAVGHINSHSSHHTDAIVTADPASVRFFTQFVDSAGVFVNACSAGATSPQTTAPDARTSATRRSRARCRRRSPPRGPRPRTREGPRCERRSSRRRPRAASRAASSPRAPPPADGKC
ncbi:glutamate-5-semialdehyde dehydrogenase [Emiliania huxleyi CCMP1516]|uniref:glutamate-5-semialdehyde dehydrogenase n=2 Tax=Emiliania huxleyi TaxID=2903 RepID=A0A0D3K484_EMIH1|nr:glutamate-5-semialdehyde dehydrogenase [Emiliania huxleyi CCMP1516]EOD30569.1 glutamate-5-semialdehyde dehydrogenase [Emiliania huxleyi CCMP1516]|eukprot:XP_005782998.1 glutamate-5-semialdehyde dehydrogenase [Emiliania huxleyi CCMP1516]